MRDNILPVLQLHACEYKDISNNTPVWNRSALDYYVYIDVPHSILSRCSLYDVAEMEREGLKGVPKDAVVRDVNCWLRANISLLNTAAGLHIYRLMFVDSMTNVTLDLYFGYNIQDDNPDKPYVYMKREDGGDEVNTCS